MPKKNWGFETTQIHAGHRPDPATGATATPIYQTTSYQFRDADHAAALFALKEMGNIYTRIQNPTQEAVEAKVAALEGAPATAVGLPAALQVASGQSASTMAILNLAGAGDHIVASAALYGGTYNLFHHTLRKLGIDFTFLEDPDDLDSWRKAVRPNTKAFFGETIGNPKANILDLEGVSKVAHEAGIPLIVDNTVATPWLVQLREHGVDIIIHSTTKFLASHATTIGGVIVDCGTFDFGQNDKFPGLTQPDASYHGLNYWPALGHGAYIIKARVQLLRDLGAAISPFNAFLTIQGIETLSLRMERHNANALKVAQFLEAHDQVVQVKFAGLKSSPWHERANRLFGGKGYGSLPAFVIKGGLEAGKKFINGLELHQHVANLGDVRSLAIHPASTTHSQMNEQELRDTGIEPGLVRLSVGLETVDDIIADLETGFAAARK
ncbi:MAG: bifunctional o-acetylhomoserine/o-acetylserine sulfhydrylase [Verrucomicrobiales bacterium]|nr:bifunctional o-acetylhomoserine/o-acetylserine sulfhydrylase [Verrucomicrobiales bacterium]